MQESVEVTAERKTRIFNAAVEIFSQKGYSAATTKEIAQAAGVAEGTIFRYYKTKKSILDAIVRYFIEVMGDIAVQPIEQIFHDAQNKDLKQILRDLMKDRMSMADKLYPVMSIVLTEILFHEDLRNLLFEKFVRRCVEAFSAFQAVMVSRGMMRGDIPAEAVFRSIFANILVFVVQQKLFAQSSQLDMEREFDTIIDIIFNGIAVPQGGSLWT